MILKAGGKEFDVDTVVFDKDGLLFDSVIFWRELANSRIKASRKYFNEEQIEEWMYLMDVKTSRDKNNQVWAVEADPIGVLAVASPDEETIITGTFIKQNLNLRWPEARNISREIFKKGDLNIDLKEAIHPKKGFPRIFQRLRAAGIPYGIATSDDLNRAKKSINMFDDFSKVSFTITPKDVSYNKPAPDMLNLIAKKYKMPLSKIMMIGDSYVDVLMAKNAGSIGVGIPEFEHVRKKMKPFADVILDSLDDIQIPCSEERGDLQ